MTVEKYHGGFSFGWEVPVASIGGSGQKLRRHIRLGIFFRAGYVESLEELAYIYIKNNVTDLGKRPGVLKIHTLQKCSTVQASLRAHVDKRVSELYPESTFDSDVGALLPGLKEIVAEQGSSTVSSTVESAFDMKQSTMHDNSRSTEETFADMRPSIVCDEGESAGTFAPEVVAARAADNVVDMQVPMSNVLEEQWVSQYLPRVFPWALNYDCGGSDFPKLFADWSTIMQSEDSVLREGIQQRWRRIADEAVVTPGDYAKMLATRPEMQVAGDWMLLPGARNLHWRYEVLHSAFMVCKQKVAPGETLNRNADELIEATKKIWQRIQSNSVTIGKSKTPLNGDIRKLFSADDITSAEKIILRSYFNTTANIAGCQAIRSKIGHCCFGFRVVHGEVIFVTVSPNRRHSHMILKLSRARRNDVSLLGDDDVSRSRRTHCGPLTPRMFSEFTVFDDQCGENTELEFPVPDIFVRQGWNAQDPLSSCHHYLFFMHVVLPSIFGLRMCFRCPDCNVDRTCFRNETFHSISCQDCLGSNMKSMGGYAGLATGMAFATEYQGESTPHGHGFVSLANMYQHHNLEEIGRIIEENHRGIEPEVMLDRIKNFVNQIQKEEHFDDDQHQRELEKLESQFQSNNAGPRANVHLSKRPTCMYTCSSSPYAWGNANPACADVINDAADWQRKYEADVQFIQ